MKNKIIYVIIVMKSITTKASKLIIATYSNYLALTYL